MKSSGRKRFLRVAQVVVSVAIAAGIVGVFWLVMRGHPIPVLQTHGTIADQERDLLYITMGLSVIVVVPVFFLLFFILIKYRAGNKKAKYQPEYKNKWVEFIWWGIPGLIILVLSIITYISTHALDPYQALPGDSTLEVQVISLDYKWLFIYPEQQTATLNYLNIPANEPVHLDLTSDAPMNSFWVPALAGQIYTMPGMSTQLSFSADDTGTYNGSNANISGDGFARMRFKVNAMSQSDFNAWALKAASSSDRLSYDSYKKDLHPTHLDTSTKTYMLMDQNLYNEVMNSYMSDGSGSASKASSSTDMPGMDM